MSRIGTFFCSGTRVAVVVALALLGIRSALAAELSFAPAAGASEGHGRVGSIPAPPPGVGYSDSAPVADETSVPPFVDNAFTNQRGIACDSTLEGNAGVRVVSGFLAIWRPSTLLVDAGVSAPAANGCPAVMASTWTGIPGDSTDGTVLNASVHAANIQYAIAVTNHRNSVQELAAYLDDRRGKGYSVTDGMGPLTDVYRTLAEQTTTITSIASDATTVLYNDGGNNVGVGSSGNSHNFGTVVDLVSNIGENGSTEPSKRFYKYARPWRWSTSVKVVPALVPAESSTASTDGGYISGHEAEAMRDAIAMAYVVPQRFQEMLARAGELGENRILAGMHSPLDVIGGRMLGEAVATASLATGGNSSRKAAAFTQGQTTLIAATGVSDAAGLEALAHSQTLDGDRFADRGRNRARFMHYLTYGFKAIGARDEPVTVPKDAEVLLETRLPYLSAEQRRVVLKTTAIGSGHPVVDDAEGWGRMNLFAAADGYGAFNGDVIVSMDASAGSFSARDAWRNHISGVGKLTKQGTGTLQLTGDNCFSGGTEVQGGTLEADSETALGAGDVYVGGGMLVSAASGTVRVNGRYTQLTNTTLELSADARGSGYLQVRRAVTLGGGVLHVKLQAGFKPRFGAVINVVSSQEEIRGRFDGIVVDGYRALPVYTQKSLYLIITR